jgi:hypothetical protein
MTHSSFKSGVKNINKSAIILLIYFYDLFRHFKTQLSFICLFIDAIPTAKFMQCEMKNDRMIASRKLIVMWKNVVVGFCDVLSQYFPGETGENHKETPQDNPPLGKQCTTP